MARPSNDLLLAVRSHRAGSNTDAQLSPFGLKGDALPRAPGDTICFLRFGYCDIATLCLCRASTGTPVPMHSSQRMKRARRRDP